MGHTDKVIDADGHVLEPLEAWEQYLASAYRDRALQLIIDPNGTEQLLRAGKVLGSPKSLGVAGAVAPVVDSLSIRASSMGAHTMLWTTDYPHPERSFPGAPQIRANRPALSPTTKRKILAEGAEQFYNLAAL